MWVSIHSSNRVLSLWYFEAICWTAQIWPRSQSVTHLMSCSNDYRGSLVSSTSSQCSASPQSWRQPLERFDIDHLILCTSSLCRLFMSAFFRCSAASKTALLNNKAWHNMWINFYISNVPSQFSPSVNIFRLFSALLIATSHGKHNELLNTGVINNINYKCAQLIVWLLLHYKGFLTLLIKLLFFNIHILLEEYLCLQTSMGNPLMTNSSLVNWIMCELSKSAPRKC